ncbi:MAG: UDP-N-acetylglucosamine acyltransferase [Alphaproteobacteria bacterium]
MVNKALRAAALMCVLVLTACADQLPPLNFSPPNIGVTSHRLDAELRSISVAIARPDEQTGELDLFIAESAGTAAPTGNTVRSVWQQALQEALNRSLIFNDNPKRRLNLFVKIQKIDVPGLAASFTTDVAARYELMDRGNGDIIFMSDVSSAGTVPGDYAFLGAVRARESVNRAVQNNITRFLQMLETVDLSKPMFPAGTPVPPPVIPKKEENENLRQQEDS